MPPGCTLHSVTVTPLPAMLGPASASSPFGARGSAAGRGGSGDGGSGRGGSGGGVGRGGNEGDGGRGDGLTSRQRGGATYEVVLTGDRFLYKMARNIVGTLVLVAEGKLSADDVAAGELLSTTSSTTPTPLTTTPTPLTTSPPFFQPLNQAVWSQSYVLHPTVLCWITCGIQVHRRAMVVVVAAVMAVRARRRGVRGKRCSWGMVRCSGWRFKVNVKVTLALALALTLALVLTVGLTAAWSSVRRGYPGQNQRLLRTLVIKRRGRRWRWVVGGEC